MVQLVRLLRLVQLALPLWARYNLYYQLHLLRLHRCCLLDLYYQKALLHLLVLLFLLVQLHLFPLLVQ